MMETECNGLIPFLGIKLLNRLPQVETKVHVKPLIQVYSWTVRVMLTIGAKNGLLRTMRDRAEVIVYLHLSHIFPTNLTV